MSASAPWSVKGIDAKAREVAKDLARRSGMTLGEWLNQMILEGEDVAAAISRERDRSDAETRQERRRTPVYRETQNDIDESPRRAAPFSTAARPLAAREISSADLRRRSIFEDRVREDRYEEDRPAGEFGRVASALESLSARIEGSETRSANAVRGVSSAVESLLTRLERSEAGMAATQAEARDRFEEEALDLRSSLDRHEEGREALASRLEQAERLIDAQAERLEGLSSNLRDEREHVARLEAQLKTSAVQDTVNAVEGALGKLANQLYEHEQRHRDVVKDVRQDMVGLSHRLSQMELRDPEKTAQTAIDKVVARLAERLEQAEGRTSGAIRTLEQAFTTLDARLNRAEERGDVTDPESVQSLTRLANDLSRRVEDSRTELLNALQDRTHANADQLLRTVSERVEQAERRSAAAIERLGQDVLRIAGTLDRRVAGIETVTEDRLSRIDREIGRVNETIEQRLGRQDASHAQALERLGGEIARISERLTLRMADSERRTNQAVEGVGAMMEQQRDQARGELADRIRQSEERTAKMLEEARSRIDQKLAQVQTQSLLSESGLDTAPRNARPQSELPNPFIADVAPAAPARQPESPQPAPVQAAPAQETPAQADKSFQFMTDDFVTPAVDEPPVDLTGRLMEPITASNSEAKKKVEAFTPEFDPFAEDDLEYDLVPTGRQTEADEDASDPFADIDAAKKTAPKAAAAASPRITAEIADEGSDDDIWGRPDSRRIESVQDVEDDGGVSVSTRDALAAARAAVRASIESNETRRPGALTGLGLKPAPRRTGINGRGGKEGTLSSAFKASGVAVAFVGILGVGGLVATHYLDAGSTSQPANITSPLAAAVTTTAATDENLLKAKFDTANKLLEARAPGAVDKMTEVANQGYPQAQYVLSSVYAGDGNYVAPNPAEARKWAQRAADGGVPQAMFNLGTMYYNGDGGPKNQITAAMWFRKAAERGVSDSQYNLGLLYAQGGAMPLNPAEAYKWFTIASRAGDKDAEREAAAIRDNLTPEQRRRAEDAAAAFVPMTEASRTDGDSSVSIG